MCVCVFAFCGDYLFGNICSAVVLEAYGIVTPVASGFCGLFKPLVGRRGFSSKED